MKKIILSALLGLASLSMYAQSFLTQNGDTVMVNYSGPSDISIYNMVKSATPNDIYIKWRVIGHNIPTDWTFGGLCDNITCWDADVLNGGNYISDGYGASYEDFHAIFNGTNASMNSMAWIRVQLNDTVNMYSRTLTFVATKWAASVSNVSKGDADVSIYPNPAHNNVNVVFDANLGVKNIAVYNLIGKAVKVFKVNGNSAKLEISDTPAGIYFIRLINAQGQIVATRKFTRQ